VKFLLTSLSRISWDFRKIYIIYLNVDRTTLKIHGDLDSSHLIHRPRGCVNNQDSKIKKPPSWILREKQKCCPMMMATAAESWNSVNCQLFGFCNGNICGKSTDSVFNP